MPLDWFNGTHPNASVSIAIAKLPAKVPVDDPRYAGPILINPGGPGGSGITLALMAAQHLQTVVDPSNDDASAQADGKYYDILGFDPRGIGFTEPPAHCMPDNPSSWSWKLRESTEGILGSSDAALGRLWSMAHAFGAACKEHSEAIEGPDIKLYMSTASVARDMLEIAEKHAEWAADKSNQLTRQRTGKSVEKQTAYKRGDVQLTYIGFSYGTYLGTTFASMFPERVGRLYVDGVVNAHDYNNGLAQGSLVDTEKDMKSFYTFCSLSGPELCPLTTSTSSFEDVEQRTQQIINSLYHNPIPLNTDTGPEIFTYSDLKAIIFSALYQPALVFPGLAHLLSAVEARHGPILTAIASSLRPSHIYTCPLNTTTTSSFDLDVPQIAILCGDGPSLTGVDIPAMQSYFTLLSTVAPSAAGIWAMLRARCAAWPLRPLASFGRDANFHGETAHPILFASNVADPVTPLRSARIMAARFPGARVLVQDAAGHCTISSPTSCVVGHVKKYFQEGTLPKDNTICVPPASPWSLNSTVKGSPFYDPSLGGDEEVLVQEEVVVGEEEMTAARKLQGWGARYFGYGRGHLGRVGDVMGVLGGWEEREGGRDEL